MAINDIVDEAISGFEEDQPVRIILDNLMYDDTIKEKIRTEFRNVLKLLNFAENGSELFKSWYIDGRIYFHVVVDRKNPKDGIVKLQYLDPTKIRKVKEVKEKVDKRTGVKISETVSEFFIYTDHEDQSNRQYSTGVDVSGGVKIAPEAIICVDSGLKDAQRKRRLSHLHKSLKVINQLRIMEDSLVIYRLARAPERRIFYIDTGNLPKGKAEEHVRRMMSQYRNKIVYDVQTGEVKDERKHMNMLEDFWLPRREGGRGTEITTLPGGDNLGQIDDIVYFKNQLYKALNIPVSRLEPETQFTTGRATEISRDEVKFQKFINRLRKKFSYIFLNALRTQLQLKGIVSKTDWDDISQNIKIDYVQDNHFYELRQYEALQDRLNILRDVKDYIGDYYSKDWVRRNILQMDEDEIAQMTKQIQQEKKDGEYGEEEPGGYGRY
jgi:hypothetical protein